MKAEFWKMIFADRQRSTAPRAMDQFFGLFTRGEISHICVWSAAWQTMKDTRKKL
jgi:hypothetical protein